MDNDTSTFNPHITPLLPPPWPACEFIGRDELDAVVEVVNSRSLARFIGPDIRGFTSRLEAQYSSLLGRQYVLAVNSGTTALRACLSALDIGPGDEVLVPGYAWAACYNAIVCAGAIPRLVEIDETFTMNMDDLMSKVGLHSRAVLLVHMNGGCGDVTQVAKFCREKGLKLIEDCCQVNGGSYCDTPLGSFGDMAVFSFGLNKTVTGGEGGLIACDDESLYHRAWTFHDQGYWRDRSHPKPHADSIPTTWGIGGHISELTSAVVFAQSQKIHTIVDAMRTRQRLLYQSLSDLPDVAFRPGTATRNDIGSFLLMTWPDKDCCERAVALTRAAGVCTSDGYGNLSLTQMGIHIYYNNSSLLNKVGLNSVGRPWTDPLNAFSSSYSYVKGTLPMTDSLLFRTQLLFVSPVLSEESIGRIANAFYEVCRKG